MTSGLLFSTAILVSFIKLDLPCSNGGNCGGVTGSSTLKPAEVVQSTFSVGNSFDISRILKSELTELSCCHWKKSEYE